ncbi:MAG TPA: iron-containing redox enzyme family protein [candidate division Zixibacteria bacterium]|nr:iron-containing redox enzyme family protein [candidate division Zixibacteria bacterium]
MDRDTFREKLLTVMEGKDHWAWPAFVSGRVPREKLHLHFEQEYATYVRDFPVLVGRAYVQCPIPEVRRSLAENLYEEETGGLIAGKPHPELFLEYARGLGMDLSRFENIELVPAARRYRDYLDDATLRRGWDVAAAIVTIFVEGTKDERSLFEAAIAPTPPPLEEHPLVKHYGMSVEHLALTKAHRQVEGRHRTLAWTAILEHVEPVRRSVVAAAMSGALVRWLQYRDEVAALCGIERDGLRREPAAV